MPSIILFLPPIGVKIGGMNENLTLRASIPNQLAGLIGKFVQSEVSPNQSLAKYIRNSIVSEK
ncbi:MAG TPA: hypothetical protein DEG17_10060 [Cyanobacteria bacterium UBA11149]|nr:hypothetical protein [Cyanobacteria bacterium UBA11367]HBE57112.1 hypothetical protein [Cyanobacteria bacterium UBA11366]HBK65586.1 hypothetical protein [Cyanobacteria bacterium UBA11166]HBR74525.1 hypothetical protein [Cyanobacteria bacterium UBA11159]HBS71256.1 hypothetical protein [Cyanobacteria bacterium UBA11153]HBW89192.1 hypothetical protein [Cyanobacteria bacterium UBA11149]HCA93620.1 hypothetical protein [Cyanobacteria bacterium UBA9226]